MAKKKILSEKEQIILGFEKRIKHKKKQLAATRSFHRQVEKDLEAKIRRDEIQLKALKKK